MVDRTYHFRLFFHYFAQFLKVRLAYKWDFFFHSLTILFASLANLAFIWLIFEHFPHLNGWKREEVVLIYGFSLVPFSLFSTISWNLYRFGEFHIIEGNFDRVLLRPVNPLFQVLCESVRLESVSEGVMGAGLIVLCLNRLGHSLSFLDIVLMGSCFLGATLIFLSIFLILACINFWAEDRVGISAPIYNMIKFGNYPLTIYNPTLRIILTTILPFAFVGYYPSAAILHPEEFFWFGCLTPVLGVVWFMAAYGIWSLGIRSYKSTGS